MEVDRGQRLAWASPVGFGHEGHDGDGVGGDVGAEVSVEGVDVGDQPFGFAEVGVGAEVDVAGGFERAHAGVEADLGFGREVLEVTLEGGDGAEVGDRAVAGHHRVDSVEGEEAVAGGYPVGDRSGPHDGVAAVEDDVAGEHQPGVGDNDDDVAGSVGGPDLDEPHRTGRRRRVRAGR